MSRNVVSLAKEMSLREASEILSDEHISGAPVVGVDGQIEGVLSMTDILSAELGKLRRREHRRVRFSRLADAEEAEEPHALEEEESPEEILDLMTVGQAMTRKAIGVAPDTPLPTLARIMWRERIHRVLVLERGSLAGLVSSMDLLRAVARIARPTSAMQE